MRDWISARLDRKFLVFLGIEMLTASLVFLVLFLGLYYGQLSRERAQASAQVNRVLQTALENAMLKRDLDGLRDIVFYLGQQENIRRVTIINPQGEVRFSSIPQTINSIMPPEPGGFRETHTRFLVDEFGREVLRSVNPVHNREPCNRCHGPIAEHPVNGILIVDYDAHNLRRSATRTGLALMASGGLVVLAALGGMWWMLRRQVLAPLTRLREASHGLSNGDLTVRVGELGNDELAELGRSFNAMASSLQDSLETVRRQEAFLQAVIDTVPDGIRVFDDSFRIVKVNDSYCRQMGRRREEVLGTCCYASSHGRTAPCPATLVACPLVEMRRDGQPLKVIQQFLGPDGAPMPVEVHCAPLQLADGRRFYIESVRDLAADIRFSHEQKLSALGQLAAGVAHEVRNPLASVRLALQGALRSAEEGGLNVAELAQYLRLVDGQVDKCIDVTDRLLKLAVNTSGALQLVSVNPAVAETLSLLGWEAETNRVSLRTILDPDEPRVLTNDGELRMVVLNLAQNAFHAMPGGGALTVRTGHRDGMVELEFHDDGAGIKPEQQGQIFDPFFSARADGAGGTGLGLTICRTLVERWGGGIAVQSEPGQGATFTVRLPAAEEGLR